MILWKVTAQALTYPSLAIMLANAAPTRRVLGTLNGVAAASASLCRAFGPTLSGLVQSAGLSIGVLGLPWWGNSLAALLGAALCMFMVEESQAFSKADEAQIEESGYETYLEANGLETGDIVLLEDESDDAAETASVDTLPAYERRVSEAV